jgi:hypothetical protein
MPATVELHEVKERGLFIVPDECPKCKASFIGDDSALQEWQWQDAGVRAKLEENAVIPIDNADYRYGDSFHTFQFWCRKCDNEVVLEPAPAPELPSVPNIAELSGKTVADLEARILELEGKLDIVSRVADGEDDAFLAADYGGLGWEQDPHVQSVYKLRKAFEAKKEG